MVITYNGAASCKVTFGDTTVAINPVGKESTFKPTRFGADIALISQHHPDMNGVDNVTHGDKQPFVIDGPGEYEIAGTTVRGVQTSAHYSKDYTLNTAYVVKLEGMRLCFLGAIGEHKLEADTLEALDGIDILFVPINHNTLDAATAHELAVKLEAKIIIPLLYDDKELKRFLKEAGAEDVKPTDKLTIKRKDLEGSEGSVVVLKG